MTIPIKSMTVEMFDKWILLNQNIETDYEYIAGEIVEVVSNSYSSMIAFEIGFHIRLYMRQNKLNGYVTGADGGYIVRGERYIPDIGYLSTDRQSEAPRQTYVPIAPDLAVEVVSPTDSERNLLIKITNYLHANTIVWVVYPDVKEVHIFAPNQDVQRLSQSDIITSSLFPDFELLVSEIFPDAD